MIFRRNKKQRSEPETVETDDLTATDDRQPSLEAGMLPVQSPDGRAVLKGSSRCFMSSSACRACT